jgi:hypothetical protein
MTDIPEPSAADPLETLQRQFDKVNRQLIQAELKSHAARAGIIDLDGLRLLDTSTLKMNEDGSIEGAAALVDQFKRDKPWLFPTPTRSSSHPAAVPQAEEPKPRTAKDMSYAEWRQARERLLKRK